MIEVEGEDLPPETFTEEGGLVTVTVEGKRPSPLMKRNHSANCSGALCVACWALGVNQGPEISD